MKASKGSQPIGERTAQIIAQLKEALRDEFKGDFEFTVIGHGRIVAADNHRLGKVQPTIRQ